MEYINENDKKSNNKKKEKTSKINRFGGEGRIRRRQMDKLIRKSCQVEQKVTAVKINKWVIKDT